ncbi:hypothetical protein TIFTF001_049956 [Ficus carica]|uniref:Uncharacterized protein n=1 Tax=Ficus carica TaxID=3494 RepID=A0AA87Z0Z8_FICCA|nr:hypothetical protein TIFTF001_049956 [Ficus carica]
MAFSALSSSSHLCLSMKPRNLILPVRCSSASSPPSISTRSRSVQFDLKEYWTTLATEIDRKLDEATPVKYPEQLCHSMRNYVLPKGAKRALPVMCVAACELFGGDRLAAIPTACALDIVQAASMTRDDLLPFMNDDPQRRGKPSDDRIYRADMAILTGIALFPLGFQHIVSHTPSDLVPEARILRVIAELSYSIGSTGTASGKLLDLEGEPNSVESVLQKKFGQMGECSAVCGGLLAGADEEEVESLRRYGRAVGVLYQVVDDILEEKSNKGQGKSYVGVYGVEKALEVAEELRDEAKKELDGFAKKYGDTVLPLYSFLDYAVDRGFSVGVSSS